MSWGGVQLGRIFGIPIRVDYSWGVIAALMTASFAAGFGQNYPYLGLASRLSLGLSACLLLFGSVLAHELAHAVVALKNGVGIKGITLFIFGGAAEMAQEPESAGAEFRIAIAGPLMSLFLAIWFWGIYLFARGTLPAPFMDVMTLLARMNLVLVAFNIIPGFPLDGGRVLRALLWGVWGQFGAATKVASGVGSLFGSLVIFIGLAWIFLLDNIVGGVWFVFIGLFLRHAARSSYQQLLIRTALRGVRARDLMVEDVSCVPPRMRLSTVVDEVMLPNGDTSVPVVEGGLLVGMLDFDSFRGLSRADLERMTADEVMSRELAVRAVDANDEATSVLPMLQKGNTLVPVVSQGVLVGVLSRDEASRRLSTLLESPTP